MGRILQNQYSDIQEIDSLSCQEYFLWFPMHNVRSYLNGILEIPSIVSCHYARLSGFVGCLELTVAKLSTHSHTVCMAIAGNLLPIQGCLLVLVCFVCATHWYKQRAISNEEEKLTTVLVENTRKIAAIRELCCKERELGKKLERRAKQEVVSHFVEGSQYCAALPDSMKCRCVSTTPIDG